MFLRSGWSIVRSALLAKGGTSKKRLSPHLHKVPTQSNRVSPQTLQMALIHKKELHDLYSLPNIMRVLKLRRIRQVVHIACIRELRSAYKILIRKPVGRPRHRVKDNKECPALNENKIKHSTKMKAVLVHSEW